MRKALVAPSVGMATAPSVPASGRSILDDDGGGGGGDGDGGGGGSSGGGGGSDDGDGDDDDAQIRKDECAMGVRRGVEIGHRILFQIAIRTRSSPLTNLPPPRPRKREEYVCGRRGVSQRWQRHATKQLLHENDSPRTEVPIFDPRSAASREQIDFDIIE